MIRQARKMIVEANRAPGEVDVKLLRVGLLLFPQGAIAQVTLAAGTVLPIELRTSIKAGKSKPGQTIRARIMQDVPLSPRQRIKAGTKLVGEVLSASGARNGQSAEITYRFDKLRFKHQSIPLSTSLGLWPR